MNPWWSFDSEYTEILYLHGPVHDEFGYTTVTLWTRNSTSSCLVGKKKQSRNGFVIHIFDILTI